MLKYVLKKVSFVQLGFCGIYKNFDFVNLIKWAKKHQKPYGVTRMANKIIAQGDFEALEWFLKNEYSWDSKILESIFRFGTAGIIEWCFINKYINEDSTKLQYLLRNTARTTGKYNWNINRKQRKQKLLELLDNY